MTDVHGWRHFIHPDLLARLDTICATEKTILQYLITLEEQMAQIDDLKAAIAKLTTDVQALLAKQSTPPVDLASAISSVTALDGQVQTALNPPPSA